MRILIYGAPGVGKTAAARLVHAESGIKLYEGDYLREVKLPKEIGASNDPFLYIGTKQAWRHFGELSSKNTVKGLLAVRKSMQPYIEKELVDRQQVIFEAAFLDPEKLQSGELYLIVTLDEKQHREQFFHEREHFHAQYGSKELEEGFTASRYIQDYLIEEAQNLKITLVHNEGDKDKLLSQFFL